MNEKLHLTPEEMREMGYQVVDRIVNHICQLPDKPVTRNSSPSQLEKALGEPLPEQGLDFEQIIQLLDEAVFSQIMHLDHPRFFAFVPGPSNYIGALATFLASGFNVFAGTWLEASGPAQIERVTVDWIVQLFGLPKTAGGLFVSGGSMANLTALAVARQVKLGGPSENSTVYYSDQTHSSVERALKILGFRREQIRSIPSDEAFRLPLPELEAQIQKDRSEGKQPFCVIANAGTTNTGAVDPLETLAEFCNQEGLWLHADGAYGAPAILSDQGRKQLKGIESVDSLTIDPHKWLFQPYDTGCILVRNSQHLKETFHILPEYLLDVEGKEQEVNFCDYGIELTRSFRALRLWMSFKMFGIESFRRAVSHGIEMAETAEETLRRSPYWDVVSPAQLGVVTFRFVPDSMDEVTIDKLQQQIVNRMIQEGFAMISTTVLRGRTVLRLCTINPRTTKEDIRNTIQKMEDIGKTIYKI
ncbi:pyridoxal phosphate-dependent decarboxylase family protein [Paenactinomyces guangxiensis]|uniref:Aminotransferase class V-fold PLP-dependent enzyme n=1 Tax=Paenactinomyces guangxiensis TaxID=1490290 RepID=A0A7W1WR17_9BACL|nr:aminotransferase class I/II-fold pyridoxal phosphate-dependent enzyme [Paenactinomyces guangxiensis]MBA4494513.1 aminotransferase class V-fold PLP-dependent enzyme [Paenactinomyces guangxiensis]MBH8591432.1 aminotransferase class V-fold PLP-dependent enzyme [Paenactinomyces guangxiensis]